MTIPVGTVILSCTPFAHVLGTDQDRCDHCFQHSSALKKCSACKSVSYCGRNCQKQSWKMIHKIECKCFQRCAPKRPSQSVRLMLQLVLRCVDGEDTVKHDNLRCFKDLQTHASEIKSDTKRLEEFVNLCLTLREYASDVLEQERIVFPSSDQLLAIFGRLVINTFTIYDAELNALGAGIYLGPSILNHSCVPNCVPVFNGTRLTIRTIEDVKMIPKRLNDESDEETHDLAAEMLQRNYDHVSFEAFHISYADLLSPVFERNANLRSSYYFECACTRCESEREYAARADCIISPDEEAEKTDRNDAHSLFKQLNEAEEKNKTKQLDQALRLSEELLSQIDRFRNNTSLSPSDPMFSLSAKCLDLHFDVLLKTEQYERAQQIGIDLLACFRRLLPRFDPHIGVHLAKLAKLCAYLGQLETALQYYEAALSALDVSHGANHNYVQHVRSQLYVPLLQELKRLEVRQSLTNV